MVDGLNDHEHDEGGDRAVNERSGGCSTTETGGAGMITLALLGLLGLRRRRES